MINISFFKQLLNFKNSLEIDKALWWLILNRIFSLARGPINTFFVLKYLSINDQGLWYTFLSLGALSVFAELGFTTIITQFISYEYVKLKEENNLLFGDENVIDRFWALIFYSLKIYSYIIPIAIIIQVVIGFIFFRDHSAEVSIIWLSYCIIGGVSLIVNLFQSIYQGIDRVASVQKNAVVLSLFLLFFNCLFLYLNFSIWALVLSNLLASLLASFFLYKDGKSFWLQLLKYNVKKKYQFWKEVMPLQWRYAITWSSGFFVFSITTPSIYKFLSPEVAGKYGLSLAIISSINSTAYGWMSTKIPKFNMLAAKNEEIALLKLFKKSIYNSLLVYVFGIIFFIIILSVLNSYPIYRDRFLDIKNIILLILSNSALLIITSLAVYVRAHQVEPFIYFSSIQALITLVLSTIFLPIFGFDVFLILNFIFLFFIMIPYMWILFNKYRIIFKNRFVE